MIGGLSSSWCVKIVDMIQYTHPSICLNCYINRGTIYQAETFLQGVLCNDCGKRGQADFHFVYHKCPHCNSYNTRLVWASRREEIVRFVMMAKNPAIFRMACVDFQILVRSSWILWKFTCGYAHLLFIEVCSFSRFRLYIGVHCV